MIVLECAEGPDSDQQLLLGQHLSGCVHTLLLNLFSHARKTVQHLLSGIYLDYSTPGRGAAITISMHLI